MKRTRPHIADIDFVKFYRPAFSSASEARRFYSQVKTRTTKNNLALLLVNQTARMLWLADHIDRVAAGRPAFQVLFYLIAAEMVAKITFGFHEKGKSKRFVHRFFDDICPERLTHRLSSALRDPNTGRNVRVHEVVEFLYDVRCDVVHMGSYYNVHLKLEDDDFPVIVHSCGKQFETDLTVKELRQMVLEGAVQAAIGFLHDDAQDHESMLHRP
jgi:hypothetical protein